MSGVGIAVLGLGRMGKVHCRNLAGRVPGARLVHVCDADPLVARQTGERFGVPCSRDPETAVGDRQVDAVVIATPPPTHADLIIDCAAAGKPVLCEKPLAYAEDDAVAAIAAADRSGVQLQMGFQRRFDADYAAAQRRIEAGDLGLVQMLFSSMRDREAPAEPVLRRERLLFDATSHDLDAARWLAGEIREVAAFGTRLASPLYEQIGEYDNVVTVLRFAGGGLGVIDNSRATRYGFDCRTEVVGSKATVRVDHPSVRHVQWLTAGGVVRDHASSFLDRFSAAYVSELEAFAEAVRDDREPLVDGRDGLMATRLALAAERSLRLGRPVPVAGGARGQSCDLLENAGT